jgi:predicted RNase H-like nuclease
MTSGPKYLLQETHPELFFWKCNSRQRLPYKKTDEGRRQRVEILQTLGFTRIEQMLVWRFGTGIGRDDLIDACACALAARDANAIIGETKHDARGLRMEMHY